VAAREYLDTLKVGHSTDDQWKKIPFLPVLLIRIRTGSGYSGVPGSASKGAIVTQKNRNRKIVLKNVQLYFSVKTPDPDPFESWVRICIRIHTVPAKVFGWLKQNGPPWIIAPVLCLDIKKQFC
jgi:hypothetical protein